MRADAGFSDSSLRAEFGWQSILVVDPHAPNWRNYLVAAGTLDSLLQRILPNYIAAPGRGFAFAMQVCAART